MRISLPKTNRSFSVAPGQSLLDAALGASLNLPHSCKGGNCGSCRARLLQGEVYYPNGRPLGLSDGEMAEGFVLLCQARARGDLSIETFEVTTPELAVIKRLPARIERATPLSHDVMGLLLRLPAAETFHFQAGQYIDVMLPGGRRRSFSLASPPHDSSLLELHVRRVSGGEFSDRLFIEQTQRKLLTIEGPLGQFVYRPGAEDPRVDTSGIRTPDVEASGARTPDARPPDARALDDQVSGGRSSTGQASTGQTSSVRASGDRALGGQASSGQASTGRAPAGEVSDAASPPMLLIGGGTGLAPLLSILRHVIETGVDRDITIYWGVRSQRDLYAHSILEQLVGRAARLRYFPVLSEPDPAWTGLRGWVHEAAFGAIKDLRPYHVYAAGPPAMIDAVRREFALRGGDASRLFFDSFDYAPDALERQRMSAATKS